MADLTRGREPEWPTGDPVALQWWLEEGGTEKLGSNMNAWLGVISHASSRIWGASSGEECRAFRDVALAAIDAGRRMGALSPSVSTEKEIYVRMSYLRNSAESLTWRRNEMSGIADVFFGSLQLDIDAVRDKSRTWREEPVSVVKSLREIKTILKLIEPGIGYLAPDSAKRVDEWLKIRPLLP